jgi:hypothetical protein
MKQQDYIEDPYRPLLLSPEEYEFRAVIVDGRLARHHNLQLWRVTDLRKNQRRSWLELLNEYEADCAEAEAVNDHIETDAFYYPHDLLMARMMGEALREVLRHPIAVARVVIGLLGTLVILAAVAAVLR